MELIPLPEQYMQNVQPMPRLGLAPAYDGKGFHGFPDRHGVPTDTLLDGKFNQLSPSMGAWLLSLVQEWIFFSLLHEFSKRLGVPLDTEKYITTDPDDTVYLTTRPLVRYMRQVLEEKAAIVPAS